MNLSLRTIIGISIIILTNGCYSKIAENTSMHTYICKKTSSPLTIDGKLNEAQWKNANCFPLVYHSQNNSNTTVSLKMLWDEKYVYIGVDIKDRKLTAKYKSRDSYVWQDDCIELYLDTEPERHHRLTYFEIDVNPNNAVFDAFFVNFYNYNTLYKLGPCEMVTCVDFNLKSAVNINGTLNNSSDVDKGWTMEMAIPISELQTRGARKIKPGTEWMANFFYHNVEDKREFMSWLSLGRDNISHRPEFFGKIYFSSL